MITYLMKKDANASGRFKRMTLKRKRPTKFNTCDVDNDDANSRKSVRSDNVLPSSPAMTLLEADDGVANLNYLKKKFGGLINNIMGSMCSSSHWWCYALDWSRKELYVLDSMPRKKKCLLGAPIMAYFSDTKQAHYVCKLLLHMLILILVSTGRILYEVFS
ncbi:hypothetical protein PIB30_091419 [Stylosanthes scabra]|uniref:Ubiquitin-like protease family profile domain-containing protein n=1 Tax=Stylosanthes scabra TaxID=79078 RepID=A0ABU6VT17_9FABA|nr:hypothetical protein [Stylosanthes scabra]